ncbi:DUF167 domain-containing protein [Candidatus Dojkabacteria bacterium]|nr:DUF167 domain-containing protein [Candidatus Dojkabacteria bacterium]
MKLSIKVVPKSSCNKVIPQPDGSLKVKVTAPPDKGEANKAVLDLLAKYFNIAKSQIAISRGETSRKKEVVILRN